ncbi:MAG: DUF2203 domain-containing protein [Acidimicrobiia bacterium]
MKEWTAEEANQSLGWVSECVEEIRTAAAGAAQRRHRARTRARSNGHGRGPSDGVPDLAQSAFERLAAVDVVLRDAERGLIDFPAVAPSGRPYWLCWVVGEPEVAWWHWQTEGFAGRKPLSTPPE